jgi:nucleotide-binding universal stress UspA family protein
VAWVNKILVPVDVGEPALEAVELALRLANPDGEITLVHVLPILTDYEAGLLMSTVTDEARADYVRTAIKKFLPEGKENAFQIKVLLGDAGHEIADFATEHGTDLIILPSHGRKGLKRILLGSVAERVVRLATCPVLVLKHPHHA